MRTCQWATQSSPAVRPSVDYPHMDRNWGDVKDLRRRLTNAAAPATRPGQIGPARSERIDVVEDRYLPQQHLADDVGRLHGLGKYRRRPGAARR